ncbi:hypothetical protein [Janthinobacterium sp.]|uniref:hypothetical protein n=1 Tax=Janthinobacterium sp. TaxID=1871054 RepID=UPI00293D2FE1|nr:hypothetical protein [Janthinobacterium sp.]
MMMAKYLSTLALGLALGCAALPAGAQELGQAVIGAPIVPPTHSLEQADAKLADVAKRRAAAEARFAYREGICYTQFFVNRCLDKAKDERRAVLVELRGIEGEANHFKRATAVAQRDAALAETQQSAQALAATRAAAPPKHLPQPYAAVAPAVGKSTAQRQADYEAKAKKQAERDSAEAGQRAANVAAFAARQRESAQRQQRVLDKQAEKDAKAAAKAREDAAAAAKK